MLKKYLVTSVFGISLVLGGCAGRTPHPVQVYQPDDNLMSCSQIEESIQYNQDQIYKLYPKTQKTGKNVALGVAGAFFLVPLFFMDFSDAEKIEIQSYQERDQRLHFLAERKRCDHVPPKMVIKMKK